jgi:hypothetical protein
MSDSTLEIRAPWTMPYLDTVGIFIDALHKRIGPNHPLYRREAFPVALRRDPDAVIFGTEDEPRIYVLVYLSWGPYGIGRRRGNDPKTEILSAWQAIQARMDMDNADWLAKVK